MWVSLIANVPSGESLVRQLLYGKRFYRGRVRQGGHREPVAA